MGALFDNLVCGIRILDDIQGVEACVRVRFLGVLDELVEKSLDAGVLKHLIQAWSDELVDLLLGKLLTLLDATVDGVGDQLSLFFGNLLLLRDLTIKDINDLLTTFEALLVVRLAESGENLLDRVLVHATTSQDSTESVTDTEIGKLNARLLFWAVLAVPLTFDLEPDSASLVAAAIIAELNPADVILLVRLVALKVLTGAFAHLFDLNYTVSAVLLPPLIEVPRVVLHTGGLTSAWVRAVRQNAEVTELAVLDLALGWALVIHQGTEPVVTTHSGTILLPLFHLFLGVVFLVPVHAVPLFVHVVFHVMGLLFIVLGPVLLSPGANLNVLKAFGHLKVAHIICFPLPFFDPFLLGVLVPLLLVPGAGCVAPVSW